MAVARAEVEAQELPPRREAVDVSPALWTMGAARARVLQQTVGNRAIGRLLGAAVVQRHEGPTTNTEVGEPEQAAVEEVSQPGETGTGSTGTGSGKITGEARVKAINDALKASNTGQWALEIIDKWKIPVDYEYGGQGSFHQGGKIYLNKTLGIGGAAIVMMHEAQHANTFKSGKQADRTKLGRAEYIKQMIADEAEAVVRQIEGLAVTQGLGVDMAGAGVDDALKQRYLKAFYKKRDELNASNPEMSTAEVNAICRTHARDTEVTNWFYDGTFVTSTDLNTYAEFYGKQWDAVNKPPAK